MSSKPFPHADHYMTAYNAVKKDSDQVTTLDHDAVAAFLKDCRPPRGLDRAFDDFVNGAPIPPHYRDLAASFIHDQINKARVEHVTGDILPLTFPEPKRFDLDTATA